MAARRGSVEASRSSGSDKDGPGQPEETEAAGSGVNLFVNDGSFLELFKKKMKAEQGGGGGGAAEPAQRSQEVEERKKKSGGALSFVRGGRDRPDRSEGNSTIAATRARVTVTVFYPLTQVGKRRGGSKLALKTGVVAKKQKTEDEVLASKGDAWAKYMAEVRKYKAHQCSDDDKTRPLVK
ncbi:telomerase RNA component interacting RNase isoform X1 [Microcaecilia unicolor]|uniref:Telomerase RNA component interacting RNase isoform X1 n=1 Tax=Microcaecilia unicolor TaxID=1415580 RepID=A0A6P7XJZ6_9AMPH|nr:telomerase RNA component interacting RNase isoform X1 [Microcaecilia unicolor]